MSAEETAQARERQQTYENATTDGVSVCTRTVTADHSLASHASCLQASRKVHVLNVWLSASFVTICHKNEYWVWP